MTNQTTATLLDHMGSDLTTVNAARVSFGKKSEWNYILDGKEFELSDFDRSNQHNLAYAKEKLSDKDAKLIHYLAKHKHFSPFGHAFASFHVKAPIFVARQLVKHKFLRWNEISRRYVDDEPEFYVPEVWRGRSEDKKQGSSGVVKLDCYIVDRTYEGDNGRIEGEVYGIKDYNDLALDMYKALLREGVAPEQARMVLPQSTLTEWYWSGSLDAFADMCKLRLKGDTQYETRLVAQQIDEVMAKLFPVSWAALVGEQ
jgi:thymidylate synthase (FAD)